MKNQFTRKASSMPLKNFFLMLSALVLVFAFKAHANDVDTPSDFDPKAGVTSDEKAREIFQQNEKAAANCTSDDPNYCIKNETSAVTCETCPDCMKARGVDCGIAVKGFSAITTDIAGAPAPGVKVRGSKTSDQK